MVSEAKRKANAKSDKKNARYISMKLNRNTDRDILDFIDSLPNKNGYFKNLIRKDMKERNK